MQITRLALTNFRNFPHLELDFPSGLTLLLGNNAQGKTNLLEAIFFLATARSPHAHAERELIRWGASTEPIPFARIEAQITRRNDETITLEIVLVQSTDDKGESVGRVSKRIKVNGVNKRALDLLGQVNVALFLPEDLEIVFGAPGERRKYLDTTLSQIDPKYGRALSKYGQVLEQRNALLRELRERGSSGATPALDIWDEQLVAEGTYIITRRAETIERYNQLIDQIHPRLTDRHEKLRLAYQPSVEHEKNVREQFIRQLSALRSREVGAAMTLVGPHRDDVRFFIDGVDMITYASRGQGRTIALSLKMAEVELMRAEVKDDPVLLLDDVMSELDRPRRRAISEAILNASQAIISATDIEDFSDGLRSSARVFAVADNHVASSDDNPVNGA